MKLQKVLFAIILLAGQQSGLWAQDPFYSQPQRAPLALNPALAGEGQTSAWRVQGNIRSQWWGGGTQPYKTSSVTLEHRISLNDAGNALVLAGSFQNEASNGGILKSNYASLGAAYHMALDATGQHRIAAGLLGTYANRLLNIAEATTQTQFGSFGFMRGSTAYDPVAAQKYQYWDVQAGLGYSYTGGQWSWHLGGALFHAAKPQESTTHDDAYELPKRKVVEGTLGYRNRQGGKWMLRSNVQWQGEHAVQQVAVDYQLPIGEEAGRMLLFGAGHRFGDAYFPYVQLDWQGISVGMSYDAITSPVRRFYNKVQSAELTLAYNFGKK